MEKYIEERGNGFPTAGAYVPGNDGHLYRVLGGGCVIETAQWKNNRSCYDVVRADWDDCDEDDVFPAMVITGESE